MPVDAAGADALAPAPLDRVVEAEDERARAGERRHEEAEEGPAPRQRGPDRAAEDAVVGAEVPLPRAAQHAQRAGDRAHPGREDRAGQQGLRGAPGAPLAEQPGEGYDEGGE